MATTGGVEDIGLASRAWGTTHTRSLRSDNGQSLFIKRGNDATWAEITNAGNTTFSLNTGMADNFNFFWGSAFDAEMKWDTSQTQDALLLTLSGSNTFIIGNGTTPNLGLANQTNPTLVLHDGSGTGANHATLSHIGTDFVIDNAKSVSDKITLRTGGINRLQVTGAKITMFDNFGAGNDYETKNEAHTLSLAAFSDTTITIPAGVSSTTTDQ